MDIQIWIPFTILLETLMYLIIVIKINTQSDLEHLRTNNLLMRLHNCGKKKWELEENIENYLNHLDEKHNASIKIAIENLRYRMEYVANILDDENYINSDKEPSSDYEQLRRRIRQNTQEMWNYFSSELGIIRKLKIKIAEPLENALELGADYKRSIIANIDRMYLVDGYELWRQNTAKNLSDSVQRRFNDIQNPKYSNNSKKIVCNTNQECGFGCQLHHILYCFLTAYATKRRFILITKGWQYQVESWEKLFQPISETSTEYNNKLEYIKTTDRRPLTKNSDLLFFGDFYVFKTEIFLPLHIPEDLTPDLTKLHGDPSVWWISQALKYLFKLNDETQKMIKINMETLGWKKPIVGVHIRRTDKLAAEAKIHSVEEYMKYVEDYYLTLEMNNKKVERRIFLATDDARVIKEARTKYPQYTIIANPDAAEKANISTRFTESSLNGLISDIHMLSLSDYLVCTFSSLICRKAYEIMQNYYPDASHRFKSLDEIYYFPGQNEHNLKAILLHKARNEYEIRIKPGDLIHVAGNNWNGFSKGRNRHSNKVGLYPSFKVTEVIETFKTLLTCNRKFFFICLNVD